MVKPRGKAEVATENAVKGDEPSNGLIENSVMLLRGTVRTLTCHIESSPHEALREAPPRQHLVQVPERSRRENAI